MSLQTTQGRSLHDIDFPAGRRSPFVEDTGYDPVYQRRAQVRLFNITTSECWCGTILVCTAYYVSVGLVLHFVSLGRSTYSIPKILHVDFRQVDAGLIVGIGGDSGPALIRDIIVATTFQLVLSLTNFLYNSLDTALYSAIE